MVLKIILATILKRKTKYEFRIEETGSQKILPVNIDFMIELCFVSKMPGFFLHGPHIRVMVYIKLRNMLIHNKLLL